MPRVAIKKKEYMISDFSKWLVAKMYEKHLRQEDVGKMINLSQPAFSLRLQKGLFSYEELLVLFKELGASDEEILRLTKL